MTDLDCGYPEPFYSMRLPEPDACDELDGVVGRQLLDNLWNAGARKIRGRHKWQEECLRFDWPKDGGIQGAIVERSWVPSIYTLGLAENSPRDHLTWIALHVVHIRGVPERKETRRVRIEMLKEFQVRRSEALNISMVFRRGWLTGA